MTAETGECQQHTLRVAVADDEAVLRDYWCMILPRLGYELLGVVCSGEELVELCESHVPDVVITDAQFVGLSGIDAVCAIRRRLPVGVVYITGRQFEDEAVRHCSSAVILAKPFSLDELRRAVDAAAVQKEGRRDVSNAQ